MLSMKLDFGWCDPSDKDELAYIEAEVEKCKRHNDCLADLAFDDGRVIVLITSEYRFELVKFVENFMGPQLKELAPTLVDEHLAK